MGLLGSKNRTQRLLKDLQTEGLAIAQNYLCRLYSPVSFEIGADTPEEIALSIIAEIQAVLNNRCWWLAERTSRLDSQRDVKMPNVSLIILAADVSRRINKVKILHLA